MTWREWFPIGIYALIVLTLFAGRVWLKANIEKPLQHKFDRKIEAVRAEFRKSEELLKSDLHSKQTEISALRDSVLSGRAQRQALLDKRRLDAAERVWSAVIALAPYKNVSSMMAVIKFDVAAERAPRERGLQAYFGMLTGNLAPPDANSLVRVAASEQLFISPLAWAYFSAYQAVVFNAYFRAKLLATGVEKAGDLLATDRIRDLLKAVLPHQIEFVDKVEVGAYHHLLDEIEQKLLDELKRMLEGTDTDTSTVDQVAMINEKLKNVLAENTEASAKVAGHAGAPL